MSERTMALLLVTGYGVLMCAAVVSGFRWVFIFGNTGRRGILPLWRLFKASEDPYEDRVRRQTLWLFLAAVGWLWILIGLIKLGVIESTY